MRARTPGVRATHGDRSDVRLVVETVSPGSVRTDRVAKRREYARAGIPNYLIVDVRGETPVLTLYDVLRRDGPGTGTRAGATTYADAVGDGSAVTLRIDGHEITLTAADIAAAL